MCKVHSFVNVQYTTKTISLSTGSRLNLSEMAAVLLTEISNILGHLLVP